MTFGETDCFYDLIFVNDNIEIHTTFQIYKSTFL